MTILGVGIIIQREDSILIVTEEDSDSLTYKKSDSLSFPLGHVESTENIFDAAVREAKEETGFDVKLQYIVGVYRHKRISGPVFVAEIFGGDIKPGNGVKKVEWMKPTDVLKEKNTRLLVHESLNDYLAGQQYPLTPTHGYNHIILLP